MTKKKEFLDDPVAYVKELDKRICGLLDEEKQDVKKMSDRELILILTPHIALPVEALVEVYSRLHDGRRAMEENKRIKASLDGVADQIKHMFKLV